jgi:hypothetical protein
MFLRLLLICALVAGAGIVPAQANVFVTTASRTSRSGAGGKQQVRELLWARSQGRDQALPGGLRPGDVVRAFRQLPEDVRTSMLQLHAYPGLASQTAQFRHIVAGYVFRILALSEAEKRSLAALKALEVTNATMQTLPAKQRRTGHAERARRSFAILRDVFATGVIELPGLSASLVTPALSALIEEGTALFHQGFHVDRRSGPSWEKSLALSAAQGIALNGYLDQALDVVHEALAELYPPEIKESARQHFILPFRRGP